MKKHPKMKGSASTWGPDEQGRYLAAGRCVGCDSLLMSEWLPSREDAIAQVHAHLDAHECTEDADAH